MSVERKQIQHYHTTNSEAIPDASDLLNGEIALNINKGNEKIFIKNNEGGISSFRGEQYYEENFLHKNDTAQSAIDLTGRIEATPEEFKYRPSAGEKSIKDDSATIKRIKGSSLVWNNLSASIPEMAAYRTNIFDFDGVNTFTVKADTNSNNLALDVTLNKRFSVLNHYYLFIVEGNTVNDIAVTAGSAYPKLSDGWAIVQCTTANKNIYVFPFGLNKDIVAGTTFTIDSIKLVDLTKMFGAGNEPTTIEEFYARIPEGVDINAYNEGELINFTAESIKTTGFNQWDEQWELGALMYGIPTDSTEYIRSKNFIKVVPNTTYYFKKPGENIYLYDINQSYIGLEWSSSNSTFTIPNNVHYIKFRLKQTTYNNDICINLSHSGVRDGEYEPYKEFTHDLSWIKKYFPNGMKSAGSVYDEITETDAIQRIGEVDLGSLDWRETTDQGSDGLRLTVGLSGHKPAAGYGKKGNAICEKLDISPAYAFNDKEMPLDSLMIYHENKSNIFVHTSCADVDSFKSSMSGVKLYYELAEPIVTPIEEIVDFSYKVGDFGTEEIISNGPTTPFKGDIVYQFNAVDRIRDNSRDIEKLKNRLNNGVKPYVIDALEFANELGNFSSDSTGGFSGNGIITEEQYNEIIKAVENKNLIFSVANTYWNYAALKSPYQGHILISTRIDPAIPGFGGLFSDIMMFIDEETLECSVVLDGRGDISSLLHRNIKTVNGESLIGSGNINIAGGSSLVSILYGELVNLRDNNGLIPGTWYRITDYITTTSQENTLSAYHPFDVIVLALSDNTLSEEARAIKSERDTDNYFGTSNLSAWKIWYCLDNDTNRFAWADTDNGTGVIYRMIDERNNDVPYDFKNILYNLDNPILVVSVGAYGSRFTGAISRNQNYDIYSGGKYFYGWDYIITNGPSTYGVVLTNTLSLSLDTVFYTQESFSPTDVVKIDKLCTQVYTFGYDSDNTLSEWSTYNNIIAPCHEHREHLIKILNGIIFGINCYNNTFGINCYNNIFGDKCMDNTFGINCIANTFSNECFSNTFGDEFSSNTVGSSFYRNTFGISCGYNTFRHRFYENILGNHCNYNIFGINCYNNTFGNYCHDNTLCNDYYNNTFGNNCDYNSIIRETVSDTPVRNFTITNGVGGSSESINEIIIPDNLLDIDYGVKIAKNSSGEIKMYCEADLIP